METSSHSRVKPEDVMTTTPMKLLAHAAASQASEAQHILSVHPTSVSFTTGLTGLTFTESSPGFRLMTSSIKAEKDRQINIPFLSPANLQKLLGHSDGGVGVKTDSRQDIGICVTIDPDKGTSPLTIVPVQFQDGGQTSPASSIANSQILHYQPSSGAGDAMLSAINYNDNEMLHDGGFDVAVNSSLPNLDDGLLGSMSNPRLTENSSAPPFDLFDGEGNVNDSYQMDSLSPQTFEEGGSALLIDNTGDAENIKLNDKKRSKPKSRQPKGQVSPEKGTLECPQCRKTFNNSSALAKHKLTHSDERKYICDVCQKAFKRQDHLNGHKMTHRDKKPYQCTLEGCEKSYCDARSLKRHLENHHQQTPEQIQQAMVIASAAAAEILAEVNNTPSSTGQQPQSSESQGSKSLNSSGVTGDNNHVHLLTKPQHHFLPQQLSSPMTSTTTSVGTTSPAEQPQTQYFQYDLIQQQQQQQQQLLLQQQLQQEKEKQETENHVRLLQHLQREQELQQQQQLNTGASKWQDQSTFYKGSPFGAGQQNSQHASSPRDGETSPGYPQQISPISPVSMGPTGTSASLLPGAGHMWFNPSKLPTLSVTEEQSNSLSQSPGDSGQDEMSKPAVCSICQKRFKNVPALNGHMRLHGGYFKKETPVKEDKKLKKGGEMAPPTGLPPRSVSGGGPLPGINQAFQLEAHSPNGNSQQGPSPFHSPIQSPGSHDSQDNNSQAIQQQLQKLSGSSFYKGSSAAKKNK
ncbi:hypothetical protein CHS0354_040149 [Potamilus streckersoni]|uniref:C2H2-type domain-containing protein n=1 Tax=Potamilus streckersoni TaxID=2493646 RepID=A0AAE0SST9_9BIVA|nr:hypothetical protein CHS0354_040149 [Potamilus streckersoni]